MLRFLQRKQERLLRQILLSFCMTEKFRPKNSYTAIKNQRGENPYNFPMDELARMARNEDKSKRTFAIFTIGERLNSSLLEEDRASYVKGFDALLTTLQSHDDDAVFHTIMILGEILDEDLLEKEEQIFLKGMSFLHFAKGRNSEVVSRSARSTHSAKTQLLQSPKDIQLTP